MKKMAHLFSIAALLSTPVPFLFSEKDNTSLSNNTESLVSTQPKDATEEVNAMDHSILPVTPNNESQEVQILLDHFAKIIGNFFSIIQDPNNPQVVGQSLANIIGSTINFAFEVINNDQLSTQANQEEITRYVEKLLDDQLQLKKHLIKLVTAKRISINKPVKN